MMTPHRHTERVPAGRHRPQQTKKDIRKEIYNRSLYLYYIFLIAGLIIIGRTLYIQYGPEGFELRDEAKNGRSFGTRSTTAKRGDILSHDNRMLATTTQTPVTFRS